MGGCLVSVNVHVCRWLSGRVFSVCERACV